MAPADRQGSLARSTVSWAGWCLMRYIAVEMVDESLKALHELDPEVAHIAGRVAAGISE
jgi:hypothetical protein